MPDEDILGAVLWTQSGINQKGEPFVQLILGDKPICQFDPGEARLYAQTLMETAEAAEQDSFMFHFSTQELKSTEQEAVMLIQEFRRFREANGKKSAPSDPKEFIVTQDHKKP